MSYTPVVPNVDDWKKNPAVALAGTKGFNSNVEIPKLIKKHYEWARAFEFGFSSKEDLPLAGASGWVHLRKENFDPETFNQAVGLRFGIQEEGGVLKINNNYIMIMPTDERKRVIQERNEDFEGKYEQNGLGAGVYVDENDPEGQKMRERLLDKYSDDVGLKEEQFSLGQPKKRGRPKKT